MLFRGFISTSLCDCSRLRARIVLLLQKQTIMTKKLILAIAVVAMPFCMQAQFGNLLERAKGKVINRADRNIDRGMDKALDIAEGEIKNPGKEVKTKSTTNGSSTPAPVSHAKTGEKEPEETKPATLTSYSKFDFVPGEKILYSEDFAGDVVAELPLTWNASGKGEVQTISGHQGKWLRAFQNNSYLSGNKKEFGENFTIEFDVIYYFQPKVTGYALPHFAFGVFSSGTEDNQENKFLKDPHPLNSAEVQISPYGGGNAYMVSTKQRAQTFSSDRAGLNGFDKHFNKPLHYSMQVQKSRFRLWINETKVFDIPRGINSNAVLNQLYFEMESSNYKDDEIGLFISNIKVATGVPDTRHKLVEQGKFSTTGILFDFQSAAIKPESYGVVKEIATVLKDNPSIKINVVGHTSNDGDANANLALSKLRSAAVKEMLVKDFAVDPLRIATDGKGGSQPVSDNKTNEGKAQNRRVEFIKI